MACKALINVVLQPPIVNIDLPSITAGGTVRAVQGCCLMMLISSAASHQSTQTLLVLQGSRAQQRTLSELVDAGVIVKRGCQCCVVCGVCLTSEAAFGDHVCASAVS